MNSTGGSTWGERSISEQTQLTNCRQVTCWSHGTVTQSRCMRIQNKGAANICTVCMCVYCKELWVIIKTRKAIYKYRPFTRCQTSGGLTALICACCFLDKMAPCSSPSWTVYRDGRLLQYREMALTILKVPGRQARKAIYAPNYKCFFPSDDFFLLPQNSSCTVLPPVSAVFRAAKKRWFRASLAILSAIFSLESHTAMWAVSKDSVSMKATHTNIEKQSRHESRDWVFSDLMR